MKLKGEHLKSKSRFSNTLQIQYIRLFPNSLWKIYRTVHGNPIFQIIETFLSLAQQVKAMRLSWADEDSSFVYFYDHENYDPIQISLANDRIKREISGELELVEQIGVKNDNKLILGDNLIALKALSKDFAKAQDKDKIKCVYIDPPYNTGLNFRNYSDKLPHSHWLSIMKPRLILLRELMSESGIILIQLDDNEYAHLDILMSEIFSESNRIGTIIWRRRQSQANLSRAMSTIHDYILVYAKNKEQCSIKSFDPLWVDTDKYGHNQIATKEIERELGDRTLFDTPKPKALLENLIQQFTEPDSCWIASRPGTTVICSQN